MGGVPIAALHLSALRGAGPFFGARMTSMMPHSLTVPADPSKFGLALSRLQEEQVRGTVEIFSVQVSDGGPFETGTYHPVLLQSTLGDPVPHASIVKATPPLIENGAYDLTVRLLKAPPDDFAGMLHPVEARDGDPGSVFGREGLTVMPADTIFLTDSRMEAVWIFRVTRVEAVPEVQRHRIFYDGLFDGSAQNPEARPIEPFAWMGWIDTDRMGDDPTAEALVASAWDIIKAYNATRLPSRFWVAGVYGPVQPPPIELYRSRLDVAVLLSGRIKLVVDDAFFRGRVWTAGDSIHVCIGVVSDGDPDAASIECGVRYVHADGESPPDWEMVLRAPIGTFLQRDSHPTHPCCAILLQRVVAPFAPGKATP